MKINRRIFTLMLIPMMALGACNNQSSEEDEQMQKNIEDLKAEMKDVQHEIDQLQKEQAADFKAEMQQVLDDFNRSVNKFEGRMEATGEEVSAHTDEALSNLQAQAKELQSKLRDVADQSEEGAMAFKEEMEHDFRQFGESIAGFFEDDK